MDDNPRILVVDDDVVDRMAVRRALRSAGLAPVLDEVDDCRAAIASLSSRKYDCVFLDFMLPDGDGLTVVRAARAAGDRTPIVILTGQGDERIAVELMKAGASDYLPKAEINAERLSQSLRNAIRVHQAEVQAQRAEEERARLLVLEQAARAEAQAAERRFAFLAEASTLLVSSLDYEKTLTSVAKLAVPFFADWCAVYVSEGPGPLRRLASFHADPRHVEGADALQREYPPVVGASYGIGFVTSAGRSTLVSEVTADYMAGIARDARHLELLRGLASRSFIAVPLVVRGETMGAIMLAVQGETSRRYGPDDLALAEDLARRAAIAIDNARLYREARSAGERLLRQLEFTRAITDHLAEGVCAIDRNGRFTFVNPAAEATLGWTAGELEGRDAAEALRFPGLACEHGDRAPLATCFSGARAIRHEETFFARKDGALIPVSFALSPLVSDGRPVGLVLSFHDTTEKKRAERELEESRQQLAMSEKLSALGTLVSGVAHEIRTPLTYIANNLVLLRRRLEAAARAEPRLDDASRELGGFIASAIEGVDRINSLVKDLRPFANPEPGRRVRLGLHEVVAGAIGFFRATQRGHAEVAASLEPTPAIQLDKGQVQRVVINLLLNAIEAMPRGGTIRVATRVVPGGGEILVEDEGTGIPPEVAARMFDPFYTTKPDGTGLGLSITRRIVEAHGGTIQFTTRAGQGTVFRIFLPALPTPEAATLAPSERSRGSTAAAIGGAPPAASPAPQRADAPPAERPTAAAPSASRTGTG